ncbi:hypothetical protein E3Q14_04371 [Wallemia mellicola]|nr:hypothetical protein E3Q14_04371 [Wallemia mellicola]
MKKDTENGAKKKPKTSAAQLRVQKDITELELPSTMSTHFPNPADLLNFELIIKPDEGMYKGGAFKFTFNISNNYPHEAPKVKLTQKIYHPNLDHQGNVCLNILREDWKPVLNLNAVVVGLQYLFLEPNAEDPLNKDAAKDLLADRNQFKAWVRSSIQFIVLYLNTSLAFSSSTTTMTTKSLSDAHKNLEITPPRIPESIFDGPSQRLLLFSGVAALQAYKLTKTFNLWTSDSSTRILDSEIALYRWALVDLSAVLVIWWLRIPRLRFQKSVWLAIIALLFALNWLLLGSWKMPLAQLSTAIIPTTLKNAFTFYKAPEEHRVRLKDVVGNRDKHLRGEHTVRVGGFSTAKINPTIQSFCLPETVSSKPLTVPILFNNTEPLVLAYSITPLLPDGSLGEEREVEIQGRELEKNKYITGYTDDDSDDFFDPNHDFYAHQSLDELALLPRGHGVAAPPRLQKTQNIRYLPLTSASALPPPPFVVKLKHVVDKNSELDARIARTEAVIVGCPSAGFASEDILGGDRCVGDKVGFQLGVRSAGGASVAWYSRGPGSHSDVRKLDSIGSTAYTTSAPHARAVSTTTSIPINVTLDKSGDYELELASLEDYFGNNPYPSLYESGLEQSSPIVQYHSHSLPLVSFSGCSAEDPVRLLEGSKSTLRVTVRGVEDSEGSVDVKIKFFDNPDLSSTPGSDIINVHIPAGQPYADIGVSKSGYYKIQEVNGKYCGGVTQMPDVCGVKSVPKPTIDMDIKTIEDCSGEVGIHALMTLTGEAPFKLSYMVEFGDEQKRVEKKIYSSRDELSLTPEREGKYKYTFLSLTDRNYKDIPMGDKGKGITATQVVHPLAGAQFAEKKNKRTVWSCEGNEVDVDIEFKGSGPWNLEFQTTGTSASSITKPVTYHENNIRDRQHTIKVPIPDEIDRLGGQFMISLVSVEDSRRCKKVLAQNDYSVQVQRVKPTARLFGTDRATILDGQTANIPVRLTGEGPWKIGYNHQGESRTVTTDKRETDLIVDSEGLYELVGIHDSHCPGTIIENEDKFYLDFIPRPSITLGESTLSSRKPRKGALHHTLAPVCKGDDSSIHLAITGEPPFEISYQHREGSLVEEERMASVRHSPNVNLDTEIAGTHKYLFSAVGDANYGLKDNGKDYVEIEQLVVERPYAVFKNSPRISYCLGDVLSPRPHEHNPVIELHGTAPWDLELEVSEETGTTSPRRVRVPGIRMPEWEVDLAPLRLNSFGTHKITIVDVHDASDCVAFDEDTQSKKTSVVDVAESATVVPVDRFEDVCVGDSMDFQLGGSAPWAVTYEWNGKPQVVKTKSSNFNRIAEDEGLFAITEVSHHSQQCPTNVDIKRIVHPLPSASVSEGNTYIEDIREGDQAEIKFTFVGTPPFTFTYERRENLPRVRHHELGKVLERHTITNVQDYEHSIFSSLEGTYVVSFIQDGYCRYPKDTRRR